MKKSAVIMGMPVTVEIKDGTVKESDIKRVFDYLRQVDAEYSPFKETSEVAKYNRGEKINIGLKKILRLAKDLKRQTNGYFDIMRLDGKMDPSGIVKGWAIFNAANMLKKSGYKKFFVDIAGDAEIVGRGWKWGIKNPFKKSEIVKVLNLGNCGIATSGTYERGQHIYDPVAKINKITDIVGMTVIGENVYEADKFATPAFAMGRGGIKFIESQKGLEGYMIDSDGIATMTSDFKKYEIR